MAIRTAACLPALGRRLARHRRVACCCRRAARYPVDRDALERPDLIWNASAHDQHVEHRRCPARDQRPAAPRALRLQLQSGRRRARFGPGRGGLLARGPVLRRARRVPDRHRRLRRHRAAGDHPARAPRRARVATDTCTCWPTIRRSRRWAKPSPTPRCFGSWPQRMGFAEPCFRDSDEEIARHAFRHGHPRMQGLDWERLKADGWQRLNVPACYAPFAAGQLSHPVGQMRVLFGVVAARGHRSAAHLYAAARVGGEQPGARRALSAGDDLAAGAPRAQFKLCQPADFPGAASRRRNWKSTPTTPPRAASSTASACACSTTAARWCSPHGSAAGTRPGVVVALSIWWRKLSPDGTNANMVTGQGLTDLGRGATFYDCLVEARATRRLA